MAEIGSLIEDKYKILTQIGKGGMSRVYLAMDKNLNKQWAIKEVVRKSNDKESDAIIKSALVEANMMKKLDHPLLPRIVDIIQKLDRIYVVMDYIEGEPLSRVLEKEGALPQDKVIKWAKDLCSVLDYLHNQTPPIIYRDMKPANVMLKPDGTIKLIDFGIAREYKAENLADTVSLGTKGYAAPEQFGGHGQTDARTDIYCLGVTLYHLVTGKNPTEPPYEIYPIRYWNPSLSSGFEKIILKCTQMNPADRYQNCAELEYALEHYEEADEKYIVEVKKKVRFFGSFVAAALVSLAIGIAGQVLKSNTNSKDYSIAMQKAETAATDDEKIKYYSEAISIKPTDTEPYYGLVETFKSDADFSVDEEKIFNQEINIDLEGLKKNKDYPNLAFEIGKLYWYYYGYGLEGNSDNDITRMKSSVNWFNDVVDIGGDTNKNYQLARIYQGIGEFNKDVTLKVNEASDSGSYKPYYEKLTKLYDSLQYEDNEIVRLEGYKLCLSALETYARKFMQDGIGEDDMTGFVSNLDKGVSLVDTSTDKTSELKDSINSRVPYADEAVKNAFIPTKASDDSEGD